MRVKSFIYYLILALLLVACATLPASAPTVVAENPITQAPVTETPIPYVPPSENTPNPPISIYPAPLTPGPSPMVTPLSDYEPQPGDNHMRRDPITLDLAASQLVITGSEPVEVKAILNGNLPDLKHLLRVVVTPPDAQNIINVEAYSVVPPGILTVLVEMPFSAEIPLGTYTSGEYTVMVNGEQLGQFVADYAPQPGDKTLTRGEVSLDMTATELVMMGAQQKEPTAVLSGNLPDPCHQLRIVLSPADSQNKINLQVYSVFDQKMMCIMVIKTFQVSVPLGNYPPGHYSVYVNDQLLGEFDQ